MIAKHIKRTKGGSYSRLANYIGGLTEYIAGVNDLEEKLDQFWAVNSDAGEGIEDINHIIAEITATQSLNKRAKSDKTYHLIVSFRDEFRPVERGVNEGQAEFEARQEKRKEDLVAIEQHFAEALGFEKHQRIAATHTNTINFHMHIAFNKINPETSNIHNPSHDFKKLERACRDVERKYSLKVDRGRSDALETNPKPVKARDMEAHTWQKSFFSYVEGLKLEIKDVRTAAKSWGDLHFGLEEYGLKLEKKGNGLVISDLLGDNGSIKASSFSRDFSKAALEKEFGDFFEPSVAEEVSQYAAAVSSNIKDDCKNAENWEDIHSALGKYDLQLKATDDSLSIEHAANEGAGFDASFLGVEFERVNLEERLGSFSPPAIGYGEISAEFEDYLMSNDESYEEQVTFHGEQIRENEISIGDDDLLSSEIDEGRLPGEIDEDRLSDDVDEDRLFNDTDEDHLSDEAPEAAVGEVELRLLKEQQDSIDKKVRQSELKKVSINDYIMGLSEDIEAIRENSKSWQDFHKGLDEHGLRIGLRGNGVVISDSNHKSRKIKGSDLGRQFSKAALEKHLGPFEKFNREQGQGTFVNHVQDALLGLETKLDDAKSWEYLHGYLRKSGLELKVKKNIFKKDILVVRDVDNDENEVHAGWFGKQFSKPGLESKINRPFRPSRKGEFDEYVNDVLPNLDEWRKVARSWQSLHKSFKFQGLKMDIEDETLVVTDAYDPSRKVEISSLGKKFTKPELEKQFRRPFRMSYEDEPLTAEEKKMDEWEKFKTGRSKKGGAQDFIYRNWRNFMLVEGDLLAMTILIAHRKMIEGIFTTLDNSKDKDDGLGR